MVRATPSPPVATSGTNTWKLDQTETSLHQTITFSLMALLITYGIGSSARFEMYTLTESPQSMTFRRLFDRHVHPIRAP